jgi:hypothetical protein
MTGAAQLEERRTEIDDTIDGLAVYSDKARARAGCIVTIGGDGEFCLHEGLIVEPSEPICAFEHHHLTAYTGLADGTESLWTRRWREVDSNSRSHPTAGGDT